jgi:excisionase family DNA binding protein
MPELRSCSCACGCGATFKTSRQGDTYASLACEELHLKRRPERHLPKGVAKSANKCTDKCAERPYKRADIQMNFDEPETPAPRIPRIWLTASELAMRLSVSCSTISMWVAKGYLPFTGDTPSEKRFKLADVKLAMLEHELPRKKSHNRT